MRVERRLKLSKSSHLISTSTGQLHHLKSCKGSLLASVVPLADWFIVMRKIYFIKERIKMTEKKSEFKKGACNDLK